MILVTDITKVWQSGHWVAVTTNGFVKKNGEAVMGRGNALAMARLIPDLPVRLGRHIVENGNNVGVIYERVISFPVKPSYGGYHQVLDRVRHLYKPGQTVPGFHCRADINIIWRSAKQLVALMNRSSIPEVFLPIPGVGNGELQYDEVKPIIEFLKANRIIIISKAVILSKGR